LQPFKSFESVVLRRVAGRAFHVTGPETQNTPAPGV